MKKNLEAIIEANKNHLRNHTQHQQCLRNEIEMYRQKLTDENIVELFTTPDITTALLNKIKQQKKRLLEPTENETEQEDAKTKYNQLSDLEDKLQIINHLYIDKNELFEKINEIDNQLDKISNQNFAKLHKFDKNVISINKIKENFISINEIKEQIDNPQQKENRQKEEKLNEQKQQFTQKIINRFNNILDKLPSIKKIQTNYRRRKAKKLNIIKIQSKYRQHLANKKMKELKTQHRAVKEYILDNLTFQNNKNNADIQNIDNQIQVKISKQEIESKKQKIDFWESIFCCCSRSTIAKQEHNQLIDRFLQRVNADNNSNITVNLDTINTINDIKQAIRNN